MNQQGTEIMSANITQKIYENMIIFVLIEIGESLQP